MIGLKKLLSIAAFMLGFGALSYATNISVQRFVVGPNDTQIYNLDDDGDIAMAGTLTATGGITPTGVITTSAATPYSIQVGSATAAVPTGTPTAAGIIAFSTSYVMYVSTGTGVGAWQKVGAQ